VEGCPSCSSRDGAYPSEEEVEPLEYWKTQLESIDVYFDKHDHDD
jgi:hypothetical protein